MEETIIMDTRADFKRLAFVTKVLVVRRNFGANFAIILKA